MPLKVLGLLLVLLLGFLGPIRLRMSKMAWFYVATTAWGASSIVYYLFHGNGNYLIVLGMCLLIWIICLLAHAQIFGSLKRYGIEVAERTALWYFYILLVVLFYQLIKHQNIQFAGSSGDNMMSIFTFSTDSAIIMGMYTFFFIRKRWYVHMFFSLFFLIAAMSMATTLLWLASFAVYIMLLRPGFWIKCIGLGSGVIFLSLIAFMGRGHVAYSNAVLPRFFSDPNSGFMPRKGVAYFQTYDFLTRGPKELLTGAGVGNYSSRSTFIVGGEYVDWYPKHLIYRSPDFEKGAFSLWNKKLLSQPFSDGTANQPFSFYLQMLGEYGLVGLLLFLLLYLGFLLSRWRYLSAEGKAMIIFVLLMLAIDYWFDYFSTMLVFEWLILIDLYLRYPTKTTTAPAQENLTKPKKDTPF